MKQEHVALGILVILGLISVQGHMTALHNMDTGFNLARVNACESLGLEFSDVMVSGVVVSAQEAWLSGLGMARITVLYVATVCLAIGFMLRGLEVKK